MQLSVHPASPPPAIPVQGFTFEEFVDAVSHIEGRCELIEGEIVVSPSGGVVHQDCILQLGALLNTFLKNYRLGKVYPEFGAALDSRNYRVPDLSFYCQATLDRLRAAKKKLPQIGVLPDMVVEVLSPSNRQFDLTVKRQMYQDLGIAEYWLVDPEERAFTFLRLVNGSYVSFQRSEESEVLPGFAFDEAEFWRMVEE